MRLDEYADTLNLTLRILRYPNQNERWVASFDDCETKDDMSSCILASTYGEGGCPETAVEDYLRQIRGRILVQHATSKTYRREYVVPKTLGK